MIKLYILPFLLATVFLSACSAEKNDTQSPPVQAGSSSREDSILLASVNSMPDTPPATLRYYTKSDVAKFTMAAVMGKPPGIISVRQSDDLYIVSYVRPDDGKRFTYKVKIEGTRSIWANIDGRWRDTLDDEYITYSEEGKKLKITQVYSDHSSDSDLYSK